MRSSALHTLRVHCALVALASCAGGKTSADAPTSTDDDSDVTQDSDVGTDTDTVADSDTMDSDPVDTDAVDTDLVDTDLPDTADTDATQAPIQLGQGFVDLTADLYTTYPRFTPAQDPVSHTPPMQSGGFFVDLDADGQDEVVLTGTLPVGSPDFAAAWVLRYDPVTQALVPDDALTDALRSVPPLLGAMWDLDGDGHPDGVGGADPFNGVRWGLADVTWGDVIGSSAWLVGDNGVVVGVADLDSDGWLDLLHGQPSGGNRDSFRADFQTAPRVFETREARVASQDHVSAYVVGAAPLLRQPSTVMAFGAPLPSSTDGPTFFVQAGADAEGFALYAPTDPTPANSLYKQSPEVAGRSVSYQRPMGAAVADLDRDGRLDLTISSTAMELLVFQDIGGATFRDKTARWLVASPARLAVDTGLPQWQQVMRPWGVVAADVDRDGRNDLVVANGDDTTESFLATGGYRPTLFLRRGAAFDESGVAANLDLPESGQALSSGDLDGDGRVDFVFGGLGEPPRVYLNRVDATPPGLAVRLVGTSSNPLGIGAWVQGVDGGVTFDASVMGGTISRGPLSEPLVFVAAGADAVLDQLTIRWPSGYEQVVSGLTGGAVHRVEEPVTVHVDDADRHLPADGSSRVVVSMTPRAPDGTPRTGANVQFRVVSGTGTVVGSPSTTGATTDQSIQAPSAPGWAVLEVIVDGVALPLRPRLWWDAVP